MWFTVDLKRIEEINEEQSFEVNSNAEPVICLTGLSNAELRK